MVHQNSNLNPTPRPAGPNVQTLYGTTFPGETPHVGLVLAWVTFRCGFTHHGESISQQDRHDPIRVYAQRVAHELRISRQSVRTALSKLRLKGLLANIGGRYEINSIELTKRATRAGNAGFFAIPQHIWSVDGLRAFDRLLAGKIAACMDKAFKPARHHYAQDLGVCERTITRSLNKLEAQGVLIQTRVDLREHLHVFHRKIIQAS